MIDFFDGKYAFLSNFYESPFEFEGIEYPTNEHFFQAMKTNDISKRIAIAAAETPGKAKRMGRQVALRADWEYVKEDIMMQGLRLKFQNPALKELLKETGKAHLVEGNTWHDCTWGACSCPECADKKKHNKLGKLLMQLREEL